MSPTCRRSYVTQPPLLPNGLGAQPQPKAVDCNGSLDGSEVRSGHIGNNLVQGHG